MSSIDNSFGFDVGDEDDSTAAPGTGRGVVKVAKRDYAVGLHWNGVEDPSKAAAEARAMASSASFKAEFFCVRQGGTPQFGLGFKAQGHRSGMPSLAAHVALAKGGSWIGLFLVEGGYYLVAVRDDGILSECDRFFEDADEARNVFETFQNQTQWNETIAPSELEIPGTVPGSIETLLEGRPQVRLQEVSRSSNIMKVGIASAAIIGLIVGGMLYLDHLEQLEQLQIVDALNDTADTLLPKEQEVVIPPMPWEGKLMAAHVITECVKQVRNFPLDIPGWTVREFYCQDGTVAAVVDRDGGLGEGGGSFNWIKLMVEKEGFKPSFIAAPEGSGSRASVQWALEGIPEIPVDLQTVSLSKIRQALVTVMEERMTPVSLSAADSNEFWQGLSFRFSTKEDPVGFSDIVGAMPGAMLDVMKFNVDSNEWTLEGKVYEQLPLPQKSGN